MHNFFLTKKKLNKFQNYYDQRNDNKKELTRDERRKRQTKINRKGYSLGIDRVVMMQPEYKKINEKGGKGEKYKASEDSQIKLNNLMVLQI